METRRINTCTGQERVRVDIRANLMKHFSDKQRGDLSHGVLPAVGSG
ncbi:MAG: hypothetical protein R3F07_11625 [Opitutaceae bacterium]